MTLAIAAIAAYAEPKRQKSVRGERDMPDRAL